MSNVGRWDHIYEGVDAPIPYGDTTTYKIGADFLRGCTTIEDWGCGAGWFRTCISADSTYIGVDGSVSRFADRVADLENYQSRTDGLFMRHVLEHNYAWRKVLVNAVRQLHADPRRPAGCGGRGNPDLHDHDLVSHAARGTGDAGGDRTTGDDSQQERMLEMNVVKSELGTSW